MFEARSTYCIWAGSDPISYSYPYPDTDTSRPHDHISPHERIRMGQPKITPESIALTGLFVRRPHALSLARTPRSMETFGAAVDGEDDFLDQQPDQGDDFQHVRLLVNDRKFLAGNSVFLSHQTSQQ